MTTIMFVMYIVKGPGRFLLKVSREQVAENKRKILDAASGLFRGKGFQRVTVADVMKAAGLTHGAFYGHFKSKDDLIAQTLDHVLAGQTPEADLPRFAETYLSLAHCRNLAGGCPMAGLGAETIREAPEARAAMTAGLRKQIERLAHGLEGTSQAGNRQAAIGAWSAMVGALILARLSDDPRLSEDVLTQTRAWLAGMAAPRPPG